MREEVRDQQTRKITVADHTKTNTDRFVFLIPDAIKMFESIPREDEYIFVRNEERLTSRKINYVLEKYAERTGVDTKSSHKLRKTYASMCNAKGIPIDLIREQLGHSSLSTTYRYIYNPLTEEEGYKALSEALGETEEIEQEPVEKNEKILNFVPKMAQKSNNMDPNQSVPTLPPLYRAK